MVLVSAGPDGISVPGVGWTDQSTQYNSNLNLETSAGPNSSLLNSAALNGYVAWSLIPEDSIATVNHAASTHLQLTRVLVPANGSVGHLDFDFTTGGTVTVFWAGIYSAAGVLLATSAESHTLISTSALTPIAMTTSVNLSGGTVYYVGTTLTWSVQPVLAGSTMGGGAGTTWMTNPNLTVATANSADAGVNATLPATVTMSSNTFLANKIWVGLRA